VAQYARRSRFLEYSGVDRVRGAVNGRGGMMAPSFSSAVFVSSAVAVQFNARHGAVTIVANHQSVLTTC